MEQLKHFVDKNDRCMVLFGLLTAESSLRAKEVVEGISAELEVPYTFADAGNFLHTRKLLNVSAIPTLYLIRSSSPAANGGTGGNTTETAERIEVKLEGFAPTAYFNAAVSFFSNSGLASSGVGAQGATPKHSALVTKIPEALAALRAHGEKLAAENPILLVGNSGNTKQVYTALADQKWLNVRVINAPEEMLAVRLAFSPSSVKEANSEFLVLSLDEKPSVLTYSEVRERIESSDESVSKDFKEKMSKANAQAFEVLKQRIEKIINKAQVVLFMKGTKTQPFCKFSKEMVGLLNQAGIDFDYFDIFEDMQVREGLKIIAEWPTYPQLYVKGEFVGGLDVVKETINEAKGIQNLKTTLGL